MRHLSFTSSGAEPVSVDEARLACRVDDEVMDLDLSLSISSAREQAEHITGRTYREQQLRHEMDVWPLAAAQLSAWPVSALAITYRSAAAPTVWTTLPTSVYAWGEMFPGVVVALKSGQSWPDLADDDAGARVRIELTAGPSSPATVPGCVRRFILATVAAWFDQPSALRVGQTITINPLHERLLDGEKLWA
jgi:uncharacterized phiE125 gp8 family phage protein